jgi:alkaline phosphatase D
MGVASGDPLPNGVVLWTRLAPSPTGNGGMDGRPYAVRWEVAADDAFRNVLQQGDAVAAPQLAHSVHVDVTGLEPATEYYYRFQIGDETSAVGRTKTAPAAGAAVDRLRFGFASCSMYEHGYFSAYRDMAGENFDLIFHLGDYIYEYEQGGYDVRQGQGPLEGREHTGADDPTGETDALLEYRARLAQYRTDPDLQAAHASAPWAVTWDDHETENDYADELSENFDPREAFLARRAAAYQAYYEHMPLRPSSMPQGPDMQLYRRLTYGALAEFQILDTRQYRSDQPCGDGLQVRCPAGLDPNTTLLGPDQERWVLEGLDASDATWNVLAQQIQMAELEQGEGDVELYWQDSWPGYPAARNRILSHLMSRNISNPVVITGDIHTAWANNLKADWDDPNSQTIGSEYICTSITAGGTSPATFFEQYLAEAPHIRFFDPRHGGYTAVELTPDLWRSDFKVVANLEDPNSAVNTIATYVTEAGNPGVQPA